MTQRDHAGADLAVIVGPQKVGADAAAEEDDDQVEAGIVIARGPSGSRIGRGSHGQAVSVTARGTARSPAAGVAGWTYPPCRRGRAAEGPRAARPEDIGSYAQACASGSSRPLPRSCRGLRRDRGARSTLPL